MKLNRPVRVVVGLATAAVALYPLLIIFMVVLMLISTFSVAIEPARNSAPSAALVMLAATALLVLFQILIGFFQIGLLAFYVVHIVKNTSGSEIVRIILGIGLYLFPYIAMPVYYLLYVLPEHPPAWALMSREPTQPTLAT